jgi:hypothetical protein
MNDTKTELAMRWGKKGYYILIIYAFPKAEKGSGRMSNIDEEDTDGYDEEDEENEDNGDYDEDSMEVNQAITLAEDEDAMRQGEEALLPQIHVQEHAFTGTLPRERMISLEDEIRINKIRAKIGVLEEEYANLNKNPRNGNALTIILHNIAILTGKLASIYRRHNIEFPPAT